MPKGPPSDIGAIVEDIIRRNEIIRAAWSESHGWAPTEAADLLAKSRLDWQVSLSHCLRLWLIEPGPDEMEGHLILAWANIGSLVEGSLKFLLSVCYLDYARDPAKRGRKRKVVAPDCLSLEELRQFYQKNTIWADQEAEAWNEWILHIQQRRNAIHAYQDRDIGTFDEFFEDVRRYRKLISEVDRMPYPEAQ